MMQAELENILEAHTKWLKNEDGGIRANLRGADLRYADLRGDNLSDANLSDADLSGAGLIYADLRCANLIGANLSDADLRCANLSGTNLRGANLSGADLRYANLSDADLSGADLSGADLRCANLRGAEGLLDAINYMEAHFERTADGYIAYKTFGAMHATPEKWDIRPGSVISENANMCRADECGCGINVAPLELVRKNFEGDIWKVLIRWEWLVGVCVPYSTDGKIRCERVQLLEIVK